MFQKTEVLKKGFTIIEILLSGAIGLLLLLVMANAFFNFQKIGRVSFELDQEILVRSEIIFLAQVKLGVIDNMGRPKPLPTNIKDKMVKLRK